MLSSSSNYSIQTGQATQDHDSTKGWWAQSSLHNPTELSQQNKKNTRFWAISSRDPVRSPAPARFFFFLFLFLCLKMCLLMPFNFLTSVMCVMFWLRYISQFNSMSLDINCVINYVLNYIYIHDKLHDKWNNKLYDELYDNLYDKFYDKLGTKSWVI